MTRCQALGSTCCHLATAPPIRSSMTPLSSTWTGAFYRTEQPPMSESRRPHGRLFAKIAPSSAPSRPAQAAEPSPRAPTPSLAPWTLAGVGLSLGAGLAIPAGLRRRLRAAPPRRRASPDRAAAAGPTVRRTAARAAAAAAASTSART